MSTVVIIIVVVLILAGLFAGRGRAVVKNRGGRGLKRRFGPEYERALALHNGDVTAAEQELGERVKRYGSLRPQPLTDERRRQYEARWDALQTQFVDSPRKAAIEADSLLAQLAGDRGFPGGAQFEEQIAALSVHHPAHIHGYHRVHTAARAQNSTEEVREALVEARGLFDALVTDHPADSGRSRGQGVDGGSRPPRIRGPHTTEGSAS
ncbi:hypothetical protein [Streptomyces sp. N35]|uniref:hypothetical protein n=1 Tax=Streptomyces sp. N35 TaxID=2795730 RepID=UPI0018F7BA22|nr:hypothetical protein [Streptomyces sp. N35]